MPESLEIKNLDRLMGRISHAERNWLTRELMAKIGLYITTRIAARTRVGKDVEGNMFKPYSASYKLFRKKTGRTTDIVNLTLTGEMMASMTSEVLSDHEVRAFFMSGSGGKTDNPSKAFFIHTAQNRKFFALSEVEQTRILQMVTDHFNDILFEAT